MEKKLQQIKKEFNEAYRQVRDSQELAKLRTKYLGRKGILTDALRQVKTLASAERPRVGKVANEIKVELESIFRDAVAKSKGGKVW